MNLNVNPICKATNCFANFNGYCEILTDNGFGKHDCPFFKEGEKLKSEYEVSYTPECEQEPFIHSRRMKAIADSCLQGLTVYQIADKLGCSPDDVVDTISKCNEGV